MKNNIRVGNTVTVIGKYNPKTEVITASNILLKGLNVLLNLTSEALCRLEGWDVVLWDSDGSIL